MSEAARAKQLTSSAVCHPNKPLYGNAMCEGCYHSARFSKVHALPANIRRASCHPALRHYARGLCINCYQKEHPRDPQTIKTEKANYFQINKMERSRKNRAWFRENPGKERTYHLKSNYGLTNEQFETILLEQENCCAICHRAFQNQTPSVDHDHDTTVVRGLLCRTCNQNLGWFEKVSIKDLLSYLERGTL